MRHQVDVFVIGGGPAGLAAAIAASQKGLSVIVADGCAPPVDKTCGEGITPESVAALRELGISLAHGEGFRFRGIRFLQNGASVSADFPVGFGIGCRRPLLHEKLIARAEKSGAHLLWKTPVTGMDAEGVFAGGKKIAARWIVGADGRGSRVRRWSGLEAARNNSQRFASRRHYRIRPWSEFMEIYWGEKSQAYITPVSSEEVCVVLIAKNPAEVSFAAALATLPELRERLAGAELCSRERGAVTISKALKNVQCGNVALVGDASGSVDAITGEGLRLGFHQAFAVADSMQSGELLSYQRIHRKLARRPMLVARLMLLLGNHSGLRKRVFESFSRNPMLFAKLLAFHVGEGTPEELLSTSAALGWQLLAT